MSAPKSVVKVMKNGQVEYTSNVDKTNYYMHELSRAALRDVGKFCAKRFREMYYAHYKRKTGLSGKAIGYKVISGKNTKYPRVQLGLKKDAKAWYTMQQEFGSSTHPRLGLLAKSVQDNIAEIIKIESQYLSGLEDEAKIQALINEEEYEGDADD